uniref:Uncharacterized protein n=1 Tax=Barns Ness breadcrumb sponge aquatic picorna-like virus 3 TaxID=2021879 RepID=A0A221LFK1_9VIRU|nr:hypothetical protein [Barns Ness breadcrumb sponge aquatic picorna-like virus 3]
MMSRGLKNNRAHKTQKNKLSKQDCSASKGVNYCEPEMPPISLIVFWLLGCCCFHYQSAMDTIIRANALLFCVFLVTCILLNLLSLIRKIYVLSTKPVLEPQYGNLIKADPYLREAIQIWCLFESLKSCKNKRGIVFVIAQYLQSHTKHSLILYAYLKITRSDTMTDWTSVSGIEQIESMLDEAFGDDTLQESLDSIELSTQDGSMPWHMVVDSAFENWKEFRHSNVATKFNHFINVIVSAGMCSTANLTFKLGNVSLFSPIVSKKQLAATDVFEAFYEAVAGFMKGGWRVYQTGEVSSFFLDSSAIAAFDDSYNKIRSFHGYALTGNLRQYTDIEENDYDTLLTETIASGELLLKKISTKQTFERKYVSDRMDRMRDYLVEFTQLRTRGGLRIAPFAISLFGQSGCGKSVLTNLSINAGLIYNGLSAEKDRIATWADNDKYASSVRSHINAIIFDDFANTKEDFMDFSPAYRLIQVINNVKYLAPMADVFLKGKVSLNPYFCMVSTNVRSLNAQMYSNEPESILRRLYHVTVTPRPAYCTNGTLDSTKIREVFGNTPCADIWDLTVSYYHVQNRRNINTAAFKPVFFEGRELKDIGVNTYLRWVQVASKQHFEEQHKIIDNQEGLPQTCSHCQMCYCKCKIPISDLDTQSGNWKTSKFSNYFALKADRIKAFYENALSTYIIGANNIIIWWRRFDFLPERVLCHPRLLKVGLFFWREDLKQSLIAGNALIFMLGLCLMIHCSTLSIIWFLSMLCGMYIYTCTTIRVYEAMVRDRILDLKDIVHTYTTSWQFKYALIGVGAIAIVMAFLRSKRKEMDAQTGLNPSCFEEVCERDANINPWIVPKISELPMTSPAKSATCEQLAASLRTNLVGIASDIGKTTLGFYITSNFMIVPTHFINHHGNRDIKVRCFKRSAAFVGGCFRDKISKAFSKEIVGTDFTLAFVTGGGSMKDMRKFLPVTDQIRKCSARVVTRDIDDDELQAIPTLFKGKSIVRHTDMSFIGSYYMLPVATKNGMCMSPVISAEKGSCILGFHLGGSGSVGGCGILTLDQLERSLKDLCTVDGVILSASSGLEPHMGNFPGSTFNTSILKSTNIHSKSAVNFLKEGSCIDVYGETTGKATPYSNVADTLISNAVEEVFDVPQKWGQPKMRGKGRYPYQATLEHSAIPSLPLGSVLSRAVGDIKSTADDIKQKIPELFDAAPLTEVETVSGRIGCRFIDPMNFNTSPGFPLTGSKHCLTIDLDPEEYPNSGKPRTFVSEVWSEYAKMEETLRSGERCYAIWKSCLKDEPTKLTKDKVRVFQSAPLVLQLMIRKYFLPIVRIIQTNPIAYECAVGINAVGLEWEELWEAAMSKGGDRVLAGDYSKYDVRMPAQVTIAAFDILIDMAEKCENYSEEDLHLMRQLVNEVVYPIMAYNGDLIQLFGTNPSGQNLTVIINSLVNSLLLRCSFYTIYPKRVFKNCCSFLTYGDDVFGTIVESCDKFTHITYAEFLAEHDMKFTMPDKESTPTHYMKEKDVDFLKRKCVFNEDLGRKVGLLSEDSIFKRLHSHLLSKNLTMETHSAENIESSAYDWFYYGRDVYNDRVEKLKLVAEKSGISHLCPALDISYDKRVARWRHQYLGEKPLDEEEEVCLL